MKKIAKERNQLTTGKREFEEKYESAQRNRNIEREKDVITLFSNFFIKMWVFFSVLYLCVVFFVLYFSCHIFCFEFLCVIYFCVIYIPFCIKII